MTLVTPRGKPSGQHSTPKSSRAQAKELRSDSAAQIDTKTGRRVRKLEQLPEKRLATAPVDQRDYDERINTRAISSNDALERQLKYDNNSNRLAWHRMVRRLVLCIAAFAVSAGGAYLHKSYGFPPLATTSIAAGGLIIGGSGITLGRLTLPQRRQTRRDSRNDPE